MLTRPLMSRRSFLALLSAAPAFSALLTPTTAIAMPPSRHWRGAVVPKDLATRMKAQNAAAGSVLSEVSRNQGLRDALDSVHAPLLAQNVSIPQAFDWRQKNRVTPIKDQGSCGSCWIFGSTAAFEAAYLILNNLDAVDGAGNLAINLSEQEALDCSYGDSNCVLGGWHEAVLQYLVLYGAVDGYKYPYNTVKINCINNLGDRPYNLITWGYVGDGADPRNLVPSNDQIKTAILKYGPIVSAVATTGWDRYFKKWSDGDANPDWTTFKNGIFVGTPTKDMSINNIDHEVCIIGWDDSESVWLIKNSWGTTWGDEGFMKLSYNSNYLGYGASWMLVRPPALTANSEIDRRIRILNQKNDRTLLNRATKDRG